MDSVQHKYKPNFIPLKEAANVLSVTVNTLLDWNDNNILKPIISADGRIGYSNEQIEKFLEVQNKLQEINGNSKQSAPFKELDTKYPEVKSIPTSKVNSDQIPKNAGSITNKSKSLVGTVNKNRHSQT